MQNRLQLEEAQNLDPDQCLWEEVKGSHLYNFKWKPTSNGINFKTVGKFGNKQLVNHIEGHEALTTKDQLFYNMRAHCELNKKNVFTILPLTFPLDFSSEHSHD